jgi:hypothetical protein
MSMIAQPRGESSVNSPATVRFPFNLDKLLWRVVVKAVVDVRPLRCSSVTFMPSLSAELSL